MRPDVVAFLDHPAPAVILSRVIVGLLLPAVVIAWRVLVRLEQVDWARLQRAHLDAVGRMGRQDW
ncbi:MAG TPA: hypothetical protein VGM20_04210 [Gemmatimonadales bacterium]|jgi:hypothetical protein